VDGVPCSLAVCPASLYDRAVTARAVTAREARQAARVKPGRTATLVAAIFITSCRNYVGPPVPTVLTITVTDAGLTADLRLCRRAPCR
jgi:hypothetical protein